MFDFHLVNGVEDVSVSFEYSFTNIISHRQENNKHIYDANLHWWLLLSDLQIQVVVTFYFILFYFLFLI